MRRGIVQLGRSATGASSRGATTRSAASLFTGGGPGATVASNASTPPCANSLRHRRTVSSRTPKASATRGLVHPDNVSNIARARSASPRSREWANVSGALRCSSPAVWLTVEWLPKYAPELNDIEVVWHDLKAHHLAHQTFADGDALDRAIHTAVAALNQERTVNPLVIQPKFGSWF